MTKTETNEDTKQDEVVLNEKDKLTLRCLKCGHFLMEIITENAWLKVLCRTSECKYYNFITIWIDNDKRKVNIDLEQKKEGIKM